jgi:hypothetical protein
VHWDVVSCSWISLKECLSFFTLSCACKARECSSGDFNFNGKCSVTLNLVYWKGWLLDWMKTSVALVTSEEH